MLEKNELTALKLTVFKSLKNAKWNCNNKTGYSKYSVIDVPFSKNAYNKWFKMRIKSLSNKSEDKVSADLSIGELNKVFGENWHILRNPNSTTQQRVLGMVSMLYRPKKMDVLINPPRYYYLKFIYLV